MGRRAASVVVEEKDRPLLEGWASRRKTAQALAMRARIVLKAGAGRSATETAKQVKLHLQTVSKWRHRYTDLGVKGLLDEPRPGPPRKITDADVERVIVRTLETKPAGATPWSTRTMASGNGLEPDCD